MRILGFIPARGGSKGVPGKNIRQLGGKPLLYYTLASAKESRLLSRCILSTEDEAIARCGRELGADVPFLRPTELAQDDTPTLPVVQHVLKMLAEKGESYDAVCLLQPTSPFRREMLIDDCIRKFTESGAHTLISVRKVPAEYNPHWAFEEQSDGSLRISTGEEQIIPRRQALPTAWHRDGQIYISLCTTIMNDNSLFGRKVVGLDNSLSSPINIDTMDDWKEAEEYIKAQASR
jgi:CMP-N,N'-diacetyllegionaminic acid synthase